MPRFPRQEVQVDALAQLMVQGLKTSLALWPRPPVPWGLLHFRRYFFTLRRRRMIAAKAAAAAAYTSQQNALAELIAALKKNLRYAENTVDFDDHKLKLIGWSGKRSARSVEPPGQTRMLKGSTVADSKAKLIWHPPADGGRVEAYTVQRRRNEAGIVPGRWKDIHTAVATEIILTDQPRNEILEFRVIAVNKAGEGEPSNTEMVVL